MRIRSLVVPLALLALVPLMPGRSSVDVDDVPTTGDGFTRERGTPQDAAKDALEGVPPPAMAGKLWRNVKHPVRFTDHLGDVIVVQFWNVQEPGSRDALVTLDGLATKLASQGLVAVAVHPPRHLTEAARWLAKTPLSMPLCVDAGPMETDFVVDGYPDVHLIGRFGVVRMADLTDSELERAIDLLLSEPGPGG